jgi:hypothetical protein
MTKHEHLTLQRLMEWDDQDMATLPQRPQRARKVRTQTRTGRKATTLRSHRMGAQAR